MTAEHDQTTRLFSVEHRTVCALSGPLLFADHVQGVGYNESVDVLCPSGQVRRGQVLEVDGDRVVLQVLGGTRGLDLDATAIRARGELTTVAVGRDLVGRILDGTGRPIDNGPPLAPVAYRDVNGAPINPVVRAHPSEFIETGISAIDVLNTLVRGQKLPLFSGFGLPAMELAARIAAHARVRTAAGPSGGQFVVVFGAIGITQREASFFRQSFARTGALERAVLFLNLADDPTIERLLTPRAALTVAEHLGYEEGMHVLVILTDITNYCEALREIAAAREEIPGRRGYPGYMYTDLASLFERAGRLHGRPGSVTQLVILSMPDDDLTHPIPDLTGYITEGQIVLSRALDRRQIDPPIDVLPSLSRLMNAGIGAGKTRADHRAVADQLYALVARAAELRRLASIIGEGALTDTDCSYLPFAEEFERTFIGQGSTRRSIEDSLDLAWRLFDRFDPTELGRIPPQLLNRHRNSASPATADTNTSTDHGSSS